ncbi:DUF992 domain-containing protein [Pararhizobium mangrovi]|uniref:DUF992 domain-containing protein n=1 Tax=Pararhizobium mangrovi TaxID=2590452 RepID=A0A506UFP1_9HYPH|nr:DUF992 domain-containing protein [Pararhizobium mangrovi]TPW30667.1 DUF992 domain-containing protein [Pararhizobium mangrovi]
MLKPIVAASFALAAMGTVANAAPVKIGTLTCTSQGGTGFIIGSNKKISCTYRSGKNDTQETYTGEIKKFGLDIGKTGKSVLEWGVLVRENNKYQQGSLAGTYRGVGADASFAAGLGANLLIGGNNTGFVLQPLSVQVQQGVNLAVGVTTITLHQSAG